MTQSTLFSTETFTTDSAKDILLNCHLPEKTDSYTPIAHRLIMEQTDKAIDEMGFEVTKTRFRASMGGEVGQGEYHIRYGNDDEMGLMIAWQNSYNKTTTFKYAIGAHVFVCANGMVAGDLGSFKRKHTGSADHESISMIKEYLLDANLMFERLIQDRELLKTKTLNPRKMAELMGAMFIDEQIITSTQLNIMKRELETPTYYYGVPVCNAWSLYNFATHAFKEDNPRNWIKRHTDLHKFFSKEFGASTPVIETPSMFEIADVNIIEKATQPTEVIGTTTVDDILDMF